MNMAEHPLSDVGQPIAGAPTFIVSDIDAVSAAIASTENPASVVPADRVLNQIQSSESTSNVQTPSARQIVCRSYRAAVLTATVAAAFSLSPGAHAAQWPQSNTSGAASAFSSRIYNSDTQTSLTDIARDTTGTGSFMTPALISTQSRISNGGFFLTNLSFTDGLIARSAWSPNALRRSDLQRTTRANLPNALQLIAQVSEPTVVPSAATPAPTRLRLAKATTRAKNNAPSTTSAALPPARTATAQQYAPVVISGTSVKNAVPARASVTATRREVSVSPVQNVRNTPKLAGNMKKVITVASLKQLPPASQPLPTSFGGSRRASIIPIGADLPSSTARAENSVTTNAPVRSALPTAQPNRPARVNTLSNQLEVATGTFVVLQTATDLDTVAIANPDIADVAVVNSRAVLVNGKAPGVTSLVIVDREKIRQYQVRVVSAPGTLPRDIVAQIGLPGVSVRQVRDALVLEGEVENADEARRAVEIAGIYSKKVVNNLSIRGVPAGDQAVAAQLQTLIGLPNVTANVVGDTILLQGTVENAAQRARAEQVAAVTGRKVVNLIELPQLTLDQVRESLGSAEGPTGDLGNVSVRQVGDQIILEGTSLTQAAIDQASTIAARSGLQVINRLQLAPISAETTFTRTVAQSIGIPTVRVTGTPKRVVLQGTVPDSNAAVAAIQTARGFAAEVDNMLVTPDPIMINVDVQIAEINSNIARNLGVQLGSVALTGETPTTRTIDPTFREGTFLGGNGFVGTGGFSNIDPIRARLQALYSDGSARLLSNPRSTVISGRTATFQVGGQVPIPVASTTNGAGTSTAIEFKDFGVILEVNSLANRDGIVTLRVRTEVSQPDKSIGIIPPGGTGLIPGFSRRQTVTEVTIGPSGTLALGGLISNNVTESVSRIPVLSKIPILGALFQSKQFQRNQSELVIFVTPRVLPNTLPAGSRSFAGVAIADNTANKGTDLGNGGINTFGSGDAVNSSGNGGGSGR